MKHTINLSITIDTDKPKANIQNAIQKGLYYVLDIERVAESKKVLSIDFDTQVTKDDLEDLKVLIVGNLVIDGFVKDCTDTDDQTESEAQDVVYQSLQSILEQLGKLKSR